MGKDGRIHRKKEICNELGIGFLFVLHRTFITVRGNYWWISYLLNTVRSFCLGSNRDFLKGRLICCILCILQITTLIFTWNG